MLDYICTVKSITDGASRSVVRCKNHVSVGDIVKFYDACGDYEDYGTVIHSFISTDTGNISGLLDAAFSAKVCDALEIFTKQEGEKE